MYNPKVILGVELEVEIENDPYHATTFVSKAPIYMTGNKINPTNHVHQRHGVLVEKVEKTCGDKIIVGYDGTLDDGFEFIGKPLSLAENKVEWSKLLNNPDIAPYINGADSDPYRRDGRERYVGMHVHMSGDPITPLILGKMIFFINKQENLPFIEFVADRPMNAYCGRHNHPVKNVKNLYHSKGCVKKGKIKRLDSGYLDVMGELDPRYSTDFGLLTTTSSYSARGLSYCCHNAGLGLGQGLASHRGAIYSLPNPNTGDCEIRIFKSTIELNRFMTNLEFCVALVDFCHQATLPELTGADFSKWMNTLMCKLKYRNLFKFMREGGYTKGLIPSRNSLLNMVERGRLPEPIKAMRSVM